MIDIIQYPTKKSWKVIRVTCHQCGAIFEATQNEFEKIYDNGTAVRMLQGYSIICPFCAAKLFIHEFEAKIWTHTLEEDGSYSSYQSTQ